MSEQPRMARLRGWLLSKAVLTGFGIFGAEMSLEDMMAYINDDELVEVTPKSLRLRKKFLSPTDREIAKKKANKEREAGAA